MKPRYVYFARCVAENGMDMQSIKIGCSDNVERRIASVSVQLPFRCELLASTPGDLFTERATHLWLRASRIRGEYFHATEETMGLVEFVQKNGSLPFDIAEQEAAWWSAAKIDLAAFMKARQIDLGQVQKQTGLSAAYYSKHLEKQPWGGRKLVAAVTVTALRLGQSVRFPEDFETPKQVAA